ncbi:MAG: outer membrane protein assembly factor BamD [Bacteroidota bacterium]
MIKSFYKIIVFSLIGAMAISCSSYEKLLKSSDNEKKYEMALKYYEKKDYFRSIQLLDELTTVFRGTDKAEKVYYYYAYSYYGQENYLMANYNFKLFAKTFPSSDKAEEALYMCAYCYYMDSPEYSLDATSTYKAINELQLFINTYPKSTRVAECNKLIDDLRAKLELKSYENAQLYFQTKEYKAAIVCFNNLIKDFPDTKYREEVLFLIFKSAYYFESNSVDSKKAERIKSAVSAYKEFVSKYPQSAYIKEANSMYSNLEQEITKLNIII